MPDFLDILAEDAMKSIKEGYYETASEVASSPSSLKESILNCKRAPIIAEIKQTSPSMGALRKNSHVEKIAKSMEEGGVVGISILTEPKHFDGNIRFISKVRNQVKVPILMKDMILSLIQIEAASKIGANAILLIQSLFDRGYCEEDTQSMIKHSHCMGLEVLLETHTEDEFSSALKTDTDMIGINNRNLETLKVDLQVTKRILAKHHVEGKIIVSESGINSPRDIRSLRESGAQAFLVGTAIMKANGIKKKVMELVEAL